MEIVVYKCDFCGKSTEDRYSEKGWIRIESPSSILVTLGRPKEASSNPKTVYKNIHSKDVDFCSLDCFKKYLSFEMSPEERINLGYTEERI